MKEKLVKIIDDIVRDMLSEKGHKDVEAGFSLVIPENSAHGDFACNAAMQIVKYMKSSPKIIAEEIIKKLLERTGGEISCEVAGPGFINIKVSKKWFADTVMDIIENDKFFHNSTGAGKKVMVEFVSANPTGPLHIGHGRGAAYGDSLSRVLARSGYEVYREYYINDAGNQMNNLGLSVYYRAQEKKGLVDGSDFPENGYRGDYIKDIADTVLEKYSNILEMDRKEGLAICLQEAIDDIRSGIEKDLKDFRVEFNNWFSEKSLYKSGAVEKSLDNLRKSGKIYESDGAVWLSTQEMGDDKDRVLKKSTGEYTYFMPDIAYHENKYGRGFDRLIDIWGADHHGYIKRMRCALECLGYKQENFDVTLIQMVNLIQGGEKISMSTRSGEFIPLSWLIEEVGVDAARFFYNMRSHDAQFDFDIDLAKSKSNDNPVYYIQYAHARVHSLLANASEKGVDYKRGTGLEKSIGESEEQLIKSMIKLKYVIELAAQNLEPHRITYHLQELAGIFHSYYYSNKILSSDDVELSQGRLTICEAAAKTIKEGLDILGVSAPERM